MTSQYRTAYPSFRPGHVFSPKELATYFAFTEAELESIQRRNRTPENRLAYAVQFKVFQHLGYFAALNDIPVEVVQYVAQQLHLPQQKNLYYEHDRVCRRHRDHICTDLKITRWRKEKPISSDAPSHPARHHAIQIALKASQSMNNPADIINVVIETLRNDRYELPSFYQLERLSKHARDVVNRGLFAVLVKPLTDAQKVHLDQLLEMKSDKHRTRYNDLKALPKKPTLSHFNELLQHHQWLLSVLEVAPLVAHISKKKLHQFAEQAKSLDASDLKQFTDTKKYGLIVCLLHQAQRDAKDALGTTFNKTVAKIHKNADLKQAEVEQHSKEKTRKLLTLFSDILGDVNTQSSDLALLKAISAKIEKGGGAGPLKADCDVLIALNCGHSLHYILPFYQPKRAVLFKLLAALTLKSSTRDNTLIHALDTIRQHQASKSEYLTLKIDLSFTTQAWRKLIKQTVADKPVIHRRYLEMCVFTHLAEELHSNDIFIEGAGSFADYRQDLLAREIYLSQIRPYCEALNLPAEAGDFVRHLREQLSKAAAKVDAQFPSIEEFTIDEDNRPVLKKRGPKQRTASAIQLEAKVKERFVDRNIVDILCNAHHYTGWANHFGPISGADPKIEEPIARYIMTAFAYGSCLGPTQTAQHMRSDITPHMISWINRRHVTPKMLDNARVQLINFINGFPLLSAWGDGTACAADGNLRELREENLISELHMRYNRRGGIAYHHVANNYIALFSTFIPCGVWEAIAIIEGLLKNDSDVQPNTIHADTQGQSTVVFALAYLLGFKLMPRIRNWKELKFYRADAKTKYQHIDSLFSDKINWHLIETHWEDMMQVVLSIKAGVVSSLSLLRKLNSKSRKNKLYFAFQQLGYVVRTLFLLDYISDVELREVITDVTNKVESYNQLSEWTSFGSRILVDSNDEDEMEKAIKYNDILTNAIILQNVVDLTDILAQLKADGVEVKKEDVAFFSPYPTGHIKRFGDYDVDVRRIPPDANKTKKIDLW